MQFYQLWSQPVGQEQYFDAMHRSYCAELESQIQQQQLWLQADQFHAHQAVVVDQALYQRQLASDAIYAQQFPEGGEALAKLDQLCAQAQSTGIRAAMGGNHGYGF